MSQIPRIENRHVPGIDGVFVRAVMASEMLDVLQLASAPEQRVRLVELAVVNADGERLIEDGAGGAVQTPVFDRLSRAVYALNMPAESDMEQAEGN